MDPQRWARIESLYHAARAKEPAERPAYLEIACAQEPDLQREVESLLGCADAPLVSPVINGGEQWPAGFRLGSYEILAPLGSGGMGEVYRVRDTKLRRDVAIKVLPREFQNDPARLARFEREAQVLASLNHPHIAAIYGLEQVQGVRFLILELVEGPTLAERIARGPVPPDEALAIAGQIIEAMEYAHERSVIHRDLKPANIKLTLDGNVKLLDFGLAKALSGPDPVANPADSPTITMGGTIAGVILGTAAYMSPEQARGKAVDRRADIWSFGVVLYEMLTGKQLYTGETTSDILASLIAKEPVVDGLSLDVRPIVEKCLRKDPRKRWQAIGDVRLALEEREREPLGPTSSTPSRLKAGTAIWAATVTLALAGLAFVHFRERAPLSDLVRFQIAPPGQAEIASGSAVLSPDGRYIAFIAPGPDGPGELWVHSLESLNSRPLGVTVGQTLRMFWSPDSRYIAFTADRKLKKVKISGGPPQTLCDVQAQLTGGAWNRDGVILFGNFGHRLMQVPETGGEPIPVSPEISHGELFHGLPAFLPDQHHFLYFRQKTGLASGEIYLGSLDLKPDQQSDRPLMSGVSLGLLYVPSAGSDTGYLLFSTQDRTLMARTFDSRKLAFAGEPLPIAGGLAPGFSFSASLTGVLAYQGGTADATQSQLTWFDRQGKMLGIAGDPGTYYAVALSPDGARAAVSRDEAGNVDLWVHEFERGTNRRFTFDPGQDWLGVWSPDGRRIAFSSSRDGSLNLFRRDSNGTGKEEEMFRSDDPKFMQDWSHDGRFLLYSARNLGAEGSIMNLFVLPLEGERKPRPYLTNGFYESEGRFSPDDRFVAYASNESGRDEIYVRPFPDSSRGQWLVSKGGGVQPRWRSDGKELFYISPDSKIMAVDVSTSPTFHPGIPHALFPAPIYGGGAVHNVTRYDVAPGGKKFLIAAVSSDAAAQQPAPITVVLNWQELLRK